jgi:hypothetical protein
MASLERVRFESHEIPHTVTVVQPMGHKFPVSITQNHAKGGNLTIEAVTIQVIERFVIRNILGYKWWEIESNTVTG